MGVPKPGRHFGVHDFEGLMRHARTSEHSLQLSAAGMQAEHRTTEDTRPALYPAEHHAQDPLRVQCTPHNGLAANNSKTHGTWP